MLEYNKVDNIIIYMTMYIPSWRICAAYVVTFPRSPVSVGRGADLPPSSAVQAGRTWGGCETQRSCGDSFSYASPLPLEKI